MWQERGDDGQPPPGEILGPFPVVAYRSIGPERVVAVCSTVREAQGLAPLFTLFAVSPFWFVSLLMIFPNSPVWIVFSIVPFSAPVLVMLRLGLSGVPTWQLVTSMVVLVLSCCGVGCGWQRGCCGSIS